MRASRSRFWSKGQPSTRLAFFMPFLSFLPFCQTFNLDRQLVSSRSLSVIVGRLPIHAA